MATGMELLTALANSIRSKTGQTGTLTLAQMKTAVDGLYKLNALSPAAGASQIRNGYKAYNSSGGVITGTMSEQAGGTFSPSKSEQTIVPAGTYVTSAVKIKAIADAKVPNTAPVTILGVGKIDGTTLWSEATFTLTSISSSSAVFSYSIPAGTYTSSGHTDAGYEKYTLKITVSGTNITNFSQTITIKEASTGWSASSSYKYPNPRVTRTGTITVSLSGTPSVGTIKTEFISSKGASDETIIASSPFNFYIQ